MKSELINYDIFPKVVKSGHPELITVRPRGKQCLWGADRVEVRVCPLQERHYPSETEQNGDSIEVEVSKDGCLRFTYAFPGEQEHFIRVFSQGKRLCQLCVYSIYDDLCGLVPLMGDLHLHTIRSDGHEDPAIVAAHLRGHGYDFIAITDHKNYSGSLEAIDAYKDVPTGMCLIAGEEVHMPDCPIHIVHIGGKYSVNAMVDENYALIDKRNPGMTEKFKWAWEKGCGSEFPGTMTNTEFHAVVNDYMKDLEPIPEGIPKFTYAGFSWICNQIRKSGGLSIFAHPYWIYDVFHVDERFTDYIFGQKDFDAFEVLGGEMYYEQNGFQAAHYYDAKARGMSFPIVGSSDSHSSVNNPASFIASTMCFAKSNTTADILNAIRSKHTVAVDCISKEKRLVGDYRLIKYGWFLIDNYFPLHDEKCFEIGCAMKEYYCGDKNDGREMLEALCGRIEKMQKKYFAFD